MFTKKHSLLGLCVLSSTSSFAQGKSQATTRVSEVSVMHSNKVSHVDPVPASTSSSVESSLDIEAHQPVSITTMKPAPASGLSTCESSAAPGCGLVAITPAATAFDVSTSSAEPTVGSAIAPCAAVSETVNPTARSDLFDVPAYSLAPLTAASPSSTAYEQHVQASDNINSGSSGVSLDERLAAEIARYEAAVAVNIQQTFWYIDQAEHTANVAREYVEGIEAWEVLEVKQQELEAQNRDLVRHNMWLIQHQHDVTFNNPAVLKQHITIDTGSSHPWKTAFTLQPFSILVGLALFFILQRVIVVSRPHLRQARRAIEQVKEEARRVREIYVSITSDYPEPTPQSDSTTAEPSVDQQKAVSPISETTPSNPEARQQATQMPTSEAIVAILSSSEKKTVSPTLEAAKVESTAQSKTATVLSRQESKHTVSPSSKSPKLKQEETSLPTSKALVVVSTALENKSVSPSSKAIVIKKLKAEQKATKPTSEAAVVEPKPEQGQVIVPTSEAIPTVPAAKQENIETVLPTSEASVASSPAQQEKASPLTSVAQGESETTGKSRVNADGGEKEVPLVQEVVSRVDASTISNTERVELGTGEQNVHTASVRVEQRKVVKGKSIISKLTSVIQQHKMKNLSDAIAGVHHYRAKGPSALKQNAKRQPPATPPRRDSYDSNTPSLFTPSPASTSSFTTSTSVSSTMSMSLGSSLPASMQQQGYYNGGGYIPYTPSPASAVGFTQFNVGSNLQPTSWSSPSPAQALRANASSDVHNQHKIVIAPAVPQIQHLQQYQAPAPVFTFGVSQSGLPWANLLPHVQQLEGTGRMAQATGLINQPLAPPSLPNSFWSMDEEQENNTTVIDPALPETARTTMEIDPGLVETASTPVQATQAIVPAQQPLQPAQVNVSDEEEAMNWEGQATNMNVMAAAAEEGRRHAARIMQVAQPIATSTPVSRPMMSNDPPQRVIIPAAPRPRVTPQQSPPTSVAVQSNRQQTLTSPVLPAATNPPKISNGAPVRVIIPARPRPQIASQVQPPAVTSARIIRTPARVPSLPPFSRPMVSDDSTAEVTTPRIAPQIITRYVYLEPVNRERMLAPLSEEEEAEEAAMHRERDGVDMAAMAAAAEMARQDMARTIAEAQQTINQTVATVPGTTSVQEAFDYIRPPPSMPAPPELVRDVASTVVPAPTLAPAPELDWSQIDPSLRPAFMNQPLAPPPPTKPDYRLPTEDHSPEINPTANLPEPEPWMAPAPMAQAPAPPQNNYPATQPVLAQAITANRAEGVVDMNAMAEQAARDIAATAQVLQTERLYTEFENETDSENGNGEPVASVPAPATTTQIIIGKRKISTRPKFKATLIRKPKAHKESADQDAAAQASGSEEDEEGEA